MQLYICTNIIYIYAYIIYIICKYVHIINIHIHMHIYTLFSLSFQLPCFYLHMWDVCVCIELCNEKCVSIRKVTEKLCSLMYKTARY